MWSRPAVLDTEASTPRNHRTIEALPAASEPECLSGSQAAFSLEFCNIDREPTAVPEARTARRTRLSHAAATSRNRRLQELSGSLGVDLRARRHRHRRPERLRQEQRRRRADLGARRAECQEPARRAHGRHDLRRQRRPEADGGRRGPAEAQRCGRGAIAGPRFEGTATGTATATAEHGNGNGHAAAVESEGGVAVEVERLRSQLPSRPRKRRWRKTRR